MCTYFPFLVEPALVAYGRLFTDAIAAISFLSSRAELVVLVLPQICAERSSKASEVWSNPPEDVTQTKKEVEIYLGYWIFKFHDSIFGVFRNVQVARRNKAAKLVSYLSKNFALLSFRVTPALYCNRSRRLTCLLWSWGDNYSTTVPSRYTVEKCQRKEASMTLIAL